LTPGFLGNSRLVRWWATKNSLRPMTGRQAQSGDRGASPHLAVSRHSAKPAGLLFEQPREFP